MTDTPDRRPGPERDVGAASLNTLGTSDAGEHSTDDPRDVGPGEEAARRAAPPAPSERRPGTARPRRGRRKGASEKRSLPPDEPIPSWIEGDEPGVSQPPG